MRPAGTPPEVIAKLNAAAKKAAQAPDFAKKVEQEGLAVDCQRRRPNSTATSKAEEARWRKIVKENNIKAD